MYFSTDDGLTKAIRKRNLKRVDKLLTPRWYGSSYDVNRFYEGETSFDGYTPLAIAASLGDSEIVLRLLTAGADPNLQSQHKWVSALGSFATYLRGRTPLMMAAMRGHTAVVRLLLMSGAFVNMWSSNPENYTRSGWKSVPDDHETALFLAERYLHSETADLLRSIGGKIKLDHQETWG